MIDLTSALRVVQDENKIRNNSAILIQRGAFSRGLNNLRQGLNLMTLNRFKSIIQNLPNCDTAKIVEAIF